jgi:hypothetical protein
MIPVPCRKTRILAQPLLKPPPRNVLSGLMDLRFEVIGDREEQMNRALRSRFGWGMSPSHGGTKSNVERVKAIAPAHALYALTMK